ncbi:hypothetical protein Tco_1351711 [Tanacetum coccineum]
MEAEMEVKSKVLLQQQSLLQGSGRSGLPHTTELTAVLNERGATRKKSPFPPPRNKHTAEDQTRRNDAEKVNSTDFGYSTEKWLYRN